LILLPSGRAAGRPPRGVCAGCRARSQRPSVHGQGSPITAGPTCSSPPTDPGPSPRCVAATRL